MEAPDFGLSALRGHSHGSWYKSKGFVSFSYTLASARSLLEKLCCEHSITHKGLGSGVLLSLHVDPTC